MKKISRHYQVLLLVLLLNVLTMPYALGQELTITGSVKSGDELLPGVSISIKGTTVGTITNMDGDYSIQAKADDILVFSFIGFKTVEEAVAGRKEININLEEEATELSEVIAIGYGSVQKKDLTSAISTVKGDELAKRNVANVSQALQGQLAGVQVSSNGGSPGSEASILIRGISTINNNNPLYVVDDVPMDDISWLNPKDIENVQVLKDASASAIFGSRASNGVIVIETKKAKDGRTNISIDATYSIQDAAKKPDMANATEYAKIVNKAAANSGLDAPFADPEAFGKGTNWWDEVTQLAPIQNYSLSINKGTEDMKIASGFSYFNQDGLVKGGGYERITMKLNTEYKLAKWLSVGQNLSLSKDKTDNGPNLVWDVQRVEPNIPVYLPDYEQEGKNEYSIYHPTLYTDVPNPMGTLARSFSGTDYLRTIGNVFANFDIGHGITAESKFAFYLSEWENNDFGPTYFIESTDYTNENWVTRSHNNRTQYTWNNLVHYKTQLNEHRLNLTAGMTMESDENRYLYGEGYNAPNNHPDLRYIDSTEDTKRFASGSNNKSTRQSFLARANYSFGDKYLLTASFRADASSRFNKENRWGYFPSVSGAWNLSEEGFMSDVAWLSQAKLRAGWGQVGNDNINNDALLTTLGRTVYVFGTEREISLGQAPASVGNADLQWETVEDMNIGADLGFWNQRLTASVDYFERRSKDMLLATSIPYYLGSAWSTPYANIGTLTTKGFEVILTYRKEYASGFSMTHSLNVSKASSKITKLVEGEAIWSGNHQRLENLTRTVENGVAGEFYGMVTDGIFQNESEVINYTDEFGNVLQPHAQPGDMRFRDVNGDGKINADDRAVIGNPEADFTFGINMNFGYKNFDLSMLFTGSYGNDVLNAVKPYAGTGSERYNSFAGLLDKAWDGEGSSNSQPRLAAIDDNNNFIYSDYYIEDGSHLRLKSLQLGYNLPKDWLERVQISNARLFIGGENLFTLTKFDGLDVDLGGSALERGIDWGQYPLPRIFMVGANISF
ncbi:TonB-dependent receptor [Carboxylicivirga mesophila]|uniref:TonB-dependent receptor n=1 Tax=Carboxylicivirga mesophila TaxID=1166478 RepID=A0ABS5K8W0_9BACT|nr:TonB-dependent receptor [Carboxylicivirga mesophila]MBS2211405.1 TonB-dependent receptor [Carboxylicivirga mesophila]